MKNECPNKEDEKMKEKDKENIKKKENLGSHHRE